MEKIKMKKIEKVKKINETKKQTSFQYQKYY